MDNSQVAEIFRKIAQILEIKGANPFRIRAYLRAAQNIEELTDSLETFVKEDRLSEIPGIGKDLSEKIKEFFVSGKIKMYEDLKKTIPAGLLDLLRVPSIGPKTARLLFEKLHITSIQGLENSIAKNKLIGIFGIKEKTIENIRKGIQIYKKGRQRILLDQALVIAGNFLNSLRTLPEVKQISTAGSLRRRQETVGDIDLLVTSARPKAVIEKFVRLSQVKDILAEGATKASVRTKDDIQVDCRVVEEKSFGAALLYFTGSKNFNIKLRRLAIKKGWRLNEYGLFRKEKMVAGKTEAEMLKKLGLSYIEPELREDSGEIELAAQDKLPHLIEPKDLKGDLHLHSLWSDGANSIEELAKAAEQLGYSYIAITDHSQSLKVAKGMSVTDLGKKKQEIEAINKRLNNFRVLFGSEVDIDAEGGLDYDNKVLRQFDIVIAAIHTGFKQSRQQLTRRIVRACQNESVHIIAHPTQRLWGVRDACDLDFKEILKVAGDTNTALEINSFPQRLDLNDLYSRMAKESRVRLAITTDSHSIEQLGNMLLGVSVARRGWLLPQDVINTLSCEELLKTIKK